MKYLSAWGAYKGSVCSWLKKWLNNGEISENDTVWRGADGSYAVGDDYDQDFGDDCEYLSTGSVADWMGDFEE